MTTLRWSAIAFALVVLISMLVPGTRQARADIPFLTQTGSLVNVGDKVALTGLIGQSSCSFYLIGTPGAIDAYGSPDNSTNTVNLTPLAITDYANPPDVESQPFTPTAGQTYQIAPTSLKQVQIVADATWSGTSNVLLSCSSSVARANVSGGGSNAVGVEPIYTPSSNHLGFDYTYQGTFTEFQTFGADTTSCSLPNGAGVAFTSSDSPPGPTWGYSVGGADYLFGLAYDTACAYTDEWLAVTSVGGDGNITAVYLGNTPYGDDVDDLYLGANNYVNLSGTLGTKVVGLSDGNLCLISDIMVTSGCSSGEALVAGQNITVTPTTSPANGVIVATTAQPFFQNIDFPATPFPAGAYAVFTSDGADSALAAAVVSPCPTTGCGVTAVTASAPLAATVGLVPNISCATCVATTPSPAAAGCGRITGAWPYTIDTTGCLSSSVPTPYPTPVVTASPPLSITTTAGPPTTYLVNLGVVPSSLGGLGLNATTFTNGQCAAYSTSLGHFTGTACGGGVYTAGTNMALASNVFSVISDPTFSGKVVVNNTLQAYNVLLTPVSATSGACTDASPYGAYMGACVENTGPVANGTGIGLRGYNPNGSAALCEIGVGASTNNVTGGWTSCSMTFPGVATTTLAVSSTITASALVANRGVCTSATNVFASCGAGQSTCTLSSATSCSVTAVVVANAVCTASYDHTSTVTLTDLLPLQVGVSGTTLTLYGDTSASLSGNIVFDYTCV